jgi:Ni,Fe-hydrogenase maturation factor
MKILCLGNEFVKEDSFAKQVAQGLLGDFEVVNIKDSFELMSHVQDDKENLVILDVVDKLESVKELSVDDLQENNILTAHDFDAGFVLKLIGKGIKIIGIPMKGEVEIVREQVKEIL